MNKTAVSASIGRIVVCLLTFVAAILKFAAVAGAAGMVWIHLCGSYTPGSGSTGGTIGVATSGASHSGVSTPFQCPSTPSGSANGMEVFGSGSGVPVDSNMGWGGGFYWQGGGAQIHQGEIAYSSPPLLSSYFGWQIICGWSTRNGNTKPGELSILGLEIEAAEGSGPTVSTAPGSLGSASGGCGPGGLSHSRPTALRAHAR